MTTGIDVRTRECYVLEDAKNKVLDLMTTCKDIKSDYLQGLLDSIYNELDYQHEMLRSPQLSQLAAEQPRNTKQG
jgi:hypothetical protein